MTLYINHLNHKLIQDLLLLKKSFSLFIIYLNIFYRTSKQASFDLIFAAIPFPHTNTLLIWHFHSFYLIIHSFFFSSVFSFICPLHRICGFRLCKTVPKSREVWTLKKTLTLSNQLGLCD